jgi:hypothetical protein
MTAYSNVTCPTLTLVDADHTGQQVRQPERVNLRQRIEALLRKIFEGHEEFLGVTPD